MIHSLIFLFALFLSFSMQHSLISSLVHFRATSTHRSLFFVRRLASQSSLMNSRFVSTREMLHSRFKEALNSAFGEIGQIMPDPVVLPARPEFHHYQCNVAMPLAKILKTKPHVVAASIVSHLRCEDMVQKIEVSGPGFINMLLADTYIDSSITTMLQNSEGRRGIQRTQRSLRTVVDFSSPNIAKEMHVVSSQYFNVLNYFCYMIFRTHLLYLS